MAHKPDSDLRFMLTTGTRNVDERHFKNSRIGMLLKLFISSSFFVSFSFLLNLKLFESMIVEVVIANS